MDMMAYFLGVLIFAMIYLLMMKIMLFLDPKPPYCPHEYKYVEECQCKIIVNDNIYDCKKVNHITKCYYYDCDCNVIEKEFTISSYELKYPVEIKFDNQIREIIITEIPLYKAVSCYACNDLMVRSLISWGCDSKETIYAYRKPRKRNRAASQ